MKFVYLGILSGDVCLWTCCDAGGGSCCDGGLSGATGCVQPTEYGSGSNQNELQALQIKGDHLPQEQTYLRLFGDLLLLEGNKAAVDLIYNISSDKILLINWRINKARTVWVSGSVCTEVTVSGEVCRCHGSHVCGVQQPAVSPAVGGKNNNNLLLGSSVC